MPSQLRRNESGRSRFGGEIAQHRDSLIVARIRIALAQNHFRTGLMKLRTKQKFTRFPPRKSSNVPADGPTGDDLSEGRHVSLRIPAPYAERMQLEDFPRKVLIDTSTLITSTSIEPS